MAQYVNIELQLLQVRARFPHKSAEYCTAAGGLLEQATRKAQFSFSTVTAGCWPRHTIFTPVEYAPPLLRCSALHVHLSVLLL